MHVTTSALLFFLLPVLTLAQRTPLPATPAPTPRPTPPPQPSQTARSSVLLPFARCTSVLPRKEVRDLTTVEWNRYVNAVHRIQASGVYDRLVKLHLDYQTSIHNYPMFLPWHRYYVRQFEMQLQRIDPQVTVPYWNWAYDAQAPETSEVLSAKYFGGNGQGAKHCVMDGAFANWRPYYPRGRHCMRRQYDLEGDAISSFYGPEVINAAINDNPTYDVFRQAIEYPIHGVVHTNIGSDFSSMASPNDPLFFSHHAYVDKLYSEWQTLKGVAGRRYNGRNEDGSAARSTDRVLPWDATVAQTLDISRLCYRYEDMRPRAPAPTRTPAPVVANDATENPVANDWWNRRLVRRAHAESRDDGMDRVVRSAPTPKGTNRGGHIMYGEPSDREEPADAPLPPAPSTPRPALYTAPPPELNSTKVYNVSYNDRTNLLAIRTPKPLPEWYAVMNNYDMDTLRRREQKFGKLCVEINKIPDYVSPTCLFNQDQALTKLSKKVRTFYAVVNGTNVVPAPAASARDARNAVTRVKETVRSRSRGFFDRRNRSRAGQRLSRVIGKVVHHVLKDAYPTLAQNDDEYCDADYDDADLSGYGGDQPSHSGRPSGRMPAHDDRTKRTEAPITTPTTAYMPPNGYQKRTVKPTGQLNDGGDAYDA